MMLYFKNAFGYEYPVAVTRLVPARGYEQSQGLVVDQCPYCGRSHRHGVSVWTGDGVYGYREAHCFKGTYLLVDESNLDELRGRFIERD